MSILSSIALTACLVNLGMAAVVILNNVSSKLNRAYVLWSLAVVVWNAASIPLCSGKTLEFAYEWMLVLQAGVFFMPASLFHVSLLTVNARKYFSFLPLVYGLSILFSFLSINGLMIRGVKKMSAGYWAVANTGYYFFIVYFLAVTIWTMLILYQAQKTASPLNRKRIMALLIAIIGLWLFGSNDLLPIFGVELYPFIRKPFIPVGNVAAIGYAFIIGYSVVQHQLLDVRLGLGKIVTSGIRVGLQTLVGVFFLSFLLILFPKFVYENLIFSSLGIFVATGVITTILFPKIFGSGSERLERKLMGDNFGYHDKLEEFISSIPMSTNPDLLFEDLQVMLNKTIGIAEFRVILLEEFGNGFYFLTGFPEVEDKHCGGISSDCSLFQIVSASKSDFISFHNFNELEYERVRKELKDYFYSGAAEICFPLKTDDVTYGFLLLSEKASVDPFTKNDLDLLGRLVMNLNLVINQMRLQDKIHTEQELDLLGRISKGLAHDLNNLLTPVATLLQMSVGATSGDIEVDDLIKISDQNVQTMKNYIRDSLFFSKTRKPQMSALHLSDLVQASISVVEQRAREKGALLISTEISEEIFTLDLVLIQRLLANLLSNAVDASPAGSTIELRTLILYKGTKENKWVQFQVIDHGEGVSAENLEKMKGAFFTTKDSGDGKRGFGLGLAICRKIVHLHGGTLNISSQLGKGTTVQVDLPNGTMPVLITETNASPPVAA